MNICKAFILSAGLGTRLRPFTEHTPKPLVPFQGRPLIAYTLHNLLQARIHHIGFNAHYLGDKLLTHMDQWAQEHPFVHLYPSDERPQLLDTGGGVAKAIALMGYPEWLLIVNSDTFWLEESAAFGIIHTLRAAFDANEMDAMLGLTLQMEGYSPPIGAKGDFGGLIFTGVQILSRRLILSSSPNNPFSIKNLWHTAQSTNRLGTLLLPDAHFTHVGSADWLAQHNT